MVRFGHVNSILSRLFGTASPEMLITVTVLSLLVFLGTLAAIPLILVRLPEDYFDVRVHRKWMDGRHPALRLIGRVIKNVVGALFLLAGVAMLLLPGQGILTILIGVSLLDFPGKQRLQAGIVGRPAVLKFINSLRGRFNKPPLVIAPRS